MEQIRATWTTMLGDRIMITRMGGYGLLWLWTVMMFNSIVPYLTAPDPRTALYVGLTISLVTMVATTLFIAIALRRAERLSDNRFIVWGAAAAMTAGAVLSAFSNPDESVGMGALMLSSILTGTGSAALFVCWGEQFFGTGGRVALVELSVGSCAAFVFGFGLMVLPREAATAVIAAAPLGSAVLLGRSRRVACAHGFAARTAIALAGEGSPLSRSTVLLAVKTLSGSLLVGVISGFFDVAGGFNASVVQADYGVYLLLAGSMVTLLLSLISVLTMRDGVFYAYRFSVLVLCLGCLLTPFLGHGTTYFSVLVFAGYTCFTIVLYILCIDFATSFRINVARCLGLGFVALYGGEVLGHLLGYNVGLESTPYTLALMTLLAVGVLLIAHLFLFTEVDLIKLGIGEVSLIVPVNEDAAGTEEVEEVPADPAPLIVERYGLTPRESDVLPLLLEGRTIQRIQETLYISAGTVSTHIRHIYQKTGSNNRQELIDLAQQIAAEGAGALDTAKN
ncbi:helix-turn-helix transcriptional regulator [Eggerthellaceae bacterium 24-137]